MHARVGSREAVWTRRRSNMHWGAAGHDRGKTHELIVTLIEQEESNDHDLEGQDDQKMTQLLKWNNIRMACEPVHL